MHWYGGSIAEAVNLSKQKNAIFVVFVEGDNEQSTEMARTIDDEAVIKRLADQTNFLAIKLKSGSDNYTHFARIYQFVPVPSLFFIGRNGTPLEVVCAGVQPESLGERMDRILAQHHKDKQPAVAPSGSGASMAPLAAAPACIVRQPGEQPETSSGQATRLPQGTYLEITKSGKEYEVVCEGDVCVRRPRPQDPGPSHAPAVAQEEPPQPPAAPIASGSSESVEEKAERAKQLIDARNKEKADKDKELEKEKELERRSQGKGVAELKRWQADQELKQIQEERKREKLENNLARQRVLDQIAQDRAERRARESASAAGTEGNDASAGVPPSAMPTSGDGGPRARIQFKLPDGSSHSAAFDADAPLAEVTRYVADNLQLSSSQFSLWTAFPRRELTAPDQTLRGLSLAPSAALLVLPRHGTATVAQPSSVSSLIAFVTSLFSTLVVTPCHQAMVWVRTRLFGFGGAGGGRVGGVAGVGGVGGVGGTAAARPDPDALGLRRRANVHRLPNERAGEDDNNTWNGNSTQQM